MIVSTLEPSATVSPAGHLNDRMQKVAGTIERWTRLKKKDVPAEMWSFPPVVALVTKLDWEVLLLGNAVASRGQHATEQLDAYDVEHRLAEVENTLSALDGILSASTPAANGYGYAI